MNARTPYWPLFRNELAYEHYPRIPWALGLGFYLTLWVLVSFVPLLLLFKSSEGNLATFFTAFGDLAGFGLVWWLAMNGWLFAFATLPGISNPIQAVRAFEFMFTRAIDRRRLFRARVILIYLVLLGPLFLNVLVSTGSRATSLGFDGSNPDVEALRREQYVNTFPDHHLKVQERREHPAPIVIPRGAVVLSAWILWLSTFGLLLMQGFCVLLARQVGNTPWLAGMAIGAPVLAALLLAPWIPRMYPNLFEQGFLLFARNLVPLVVGLGALIPVVQIFCERRFRNLEIL